MSHAATPYVRQAPVMGTVASIHVHDDVPLTALVSAVDSVYAELERLEQMFSTFRPTSEISRVNRGELAFGDCSPEVFEVLDACTWLEHETGGAFTAHPPHRPGFLDPAGFVKGWAAQRSGALLGEVGLEHWYVNVGGDIQAHGSPAADRAWRVAVSDPVRREAVLAVIELPGGGAVATSGISERGRHLWSPVGLDAELLAVTVTGPELAWADAYATAVFALGEAGLDWMARFPGYEAFAIWSDHLVRMTGGFPGTFYGTEDGPTA